MITETQALDLEIKRVQLAREQLALRDELAKSGRRGKLIDVTHAAVGSSRKAVGAAADLGADAARVTGRGLRWVLTTIGKIFLTWLVVWAGMVYFNTERVPGGIAPRIDYYGHFAAQWAVPAYLVHRLWVHYNVPKAPGKTSPAVKFVAYIIGAVLAVIAVLFLAAALQ